MRSDPLVPRAGEEDESVLRPEVGRDEILRRTPDGERECCPHDRGDGDWTRPWPAPTRRGRGDVALAHAGDADASACGPPTTLPVARRSNTVRTAAAAPSRGQQAETSGPMG